MKALCWVMREGPISTHLCVSVCVCVCSQDILLPKPSKASFSKEPFNLRAGRADLDRDHHKHTLLFYNKPGVPKTTPMFPCTARRKYGFNRNTGWGSEKRRRKGKTEQTKFLPPLLTTLRCLQKQEIYSNRSGGTRWRLRDWAVHCSCFSREPWSQL